MEAAPSFGPRFPVTALAEFGRRIRHCWETRARLRPLLQTGVLFQKEICRCVLGATSSLSAIRLRPLILSDPSALKFLPPLKPLPPPTCQSAALGDVAEDSAQL